MANIFKMIWKPVLKSDGKKKSKVTIYIYLYTKWNFIFNLPKENESALTLLYLWYIVILGRKRFLPVLQVTDIFVMFNKYVAASPLMSV